MILHWLPGPPLTWPPGNCKPQRMCQVYEWSCVTAAGACGLSNFVTPQLTNGSGTAGVGLAVTGA